MRRIALGSSAFLAGASGLALESVLLSSSGLALGYGGSTAIGLATWLSAWAFGAFLAGRSRWHAARALLVIGALLAVLAVPLVWALLAAGGALAATSFAGVVAVVSIAIAGSLQGAFLPPLARISAASNGSDSASNTGDDASSKTDTAYSRHASSAERRTSKREISVTFLFAANLFGSLCGAVFVADSVTAAHGRLAAAASAGALALAAGVIGSACARSRSRSIANGTPERGAITQPRAEVTVARARGEEAFAFASDLTAWRRALWIVALTTAWMSALEWIGLRLAVLWLGGMQPALSAVLAASLCALALGAAVVPACVARGPRGLVVVLGCCTLASLWPFCAASALAVVVAQGVNGLADANESTPILVRALVLVGPMLVPFGALVPVLHRSFGHERESGRRLGDLLLFEALGAIVGVPLVHLWIVPQFGLSGAVACVLVLAVIAFVFTRSFAPRIALVGVLVALVLAAIAARAPTPTLAAPPLANPALTLLSLREDRDFAVAVVDDGIQGERTLLTDGFRAAGTGRDYRYMQALGHLPVLLHPAPTRVAVLALGTGTTVGAVASHPEVARIDVLEISLAVVEAAPFFVEKNHGALAEGMPGIIDENDGRARVVVRLGDGRRTLASSTATYDVITMEPLLPDSPFAVYLYTQEFYERARAALAPGGLVCQWIPPHALEPLTFEALLHAFARSFPWSGVWLYGTQVLLVGGEREPVLDARRFAASDTELGRDLASLGLASPADVLARWCGPAQSTRDRNARGSASLHAEQAAKQAADESAPGASTPLVGGASFERELTDADPWIVYRPRRRGAELLLDLPRNLAQLRTLAAEPSVAWLAVAGAGARTKMRDFAELRRARETQARNEAALRGAFESGATSAVQNAAQSGVRSGETRPIPDSFGDSERDPEVVAFRSEIAFLEALRQGVGLLTQDRSRAGGEAALSALIRAAELRPERADVHLYVAVALERIASPAAEKALERSLSIAPKLALTNEGQRARALGLSDAHWDRCRRRALAAQGP